jgi:hypothetical protein
MTVAGALNLFWVLSVLVALGVFVSIERRRRAQFRARCRRGFAVFLAAVALFPCISASDDLVRFGLMVPAGQSAQVEPGAASADNPAEAHSLHLARLLQILDSFQLSAAGWLLVTLFFCALFICLARVNPECWAVAASIRGPPRFTSL